MSSSSTTPTVSSSDATPSATSSQGNNNGGGPSSSLYLFTFLATLFLLLFVSSAIILRSFILRRRFRRRIEEAILAGVIQPTQTGGRGGRRRAIGEKPKLWEARVCPAANDRWDTIVPVAVQSGEQAKTAMASANAQGGERQSAAATAAAPLTPPTHDPPRPPSRRPWLRNLFAWRHSASSPSNHPPTSEASEDLPGVQRQNAPSSTHDRLRLTVLIAMPDPRRPHADGSAFAGQSKGKEKSFDLDYDEDDLPEMALGLTELLYKDSITTTKSS